MKKYIYGIFFSLAWINTQANPPKLIIQLVVDQLRGDLIQQHQQQFGSGGFHYLLQHALNYSNAHHPHANTTTCAGHATIATGSFPALHGVINNDWYDRKSKKMIYCMEDLQAPILPTSHTQINTPGRSPQNLYASTLSDEIILANKGRAFGVSLKDRSAITLAGHAGKAFWFDTSNGGFVSSSYYYKGYPLWVQNWNQQYHPDDYKWDLGHPKAEYQNLNTPVFQQLDTAFGQSFPHNISHKENQDYFKSLSKTPKADQLTADFAEHLLIEERLGLTPNKTDYLGISFSAVDAVGHQFGPNSLESEDTLLELDKTLAHLFRVIDKHIGLNHVLIVLTADHGVNNSPSYLETHHIPEIAPIDVPQMERYVQSALNEKYQLPEHTVMSVSPPYIYLDHQIIRQHQLSLRQVSAYLAEKLNFKLGVFRAYSLPVREVEKDWLSSKVNKMYFPYRSGDIYLVPPQNQSNGANSMYRVTHGSPWNYDSYVPLLFVHPSFKAQRIVRAAYTTDIAATLAALLQIKAPSAAVGHPLSEVIHASESFGN